MKQLKQLAWIVRVVGLLGFCAGAQAGLPIEIPMVPVGNPGNTGEDSGECVPGGHGPCRTCGAVDYVYNIGQFEVTAGQYTEFLKAVAAEDTYWLYDTRMWTHEWGCKIERTGSSPNYSYSVDAEWADRPVNYVSWGDAARFCNWLHNGQPTGAQGLSTTEDGSYYLNGATSLEALQAVTRKLNATYVIPSEDEWYKAAYHDPRLEAEGGPPGDDHYWYYPTQADCPPTAESPPGTDMVCGSANYYDGGYAIGPPCYRTEVGAYDAKPSDSAYGTFDQGGNVWEWNEAIMVGITGGSIRGQRGGSFYQLVDNMAASFRANHWDLDPTNALPHCGFRVAQVIPLGDLNCDSVVDNFDIDPFVLALTAPSQYAGQHPNCDWMLADINGDGFVDNFDIDPFVELLTGP